MFLAGEVEYSIGSPGSGNIWLSGIDQGGAVLTENSYVGQDVAYMPTALCAGESGSFYVASDAHLLGMGRIPVIQKYELLTVGVQQLDEEVPTEFSLCQNYPNPFNPVTTIRFAIPNEGERAGTLHATSLQVFDVLGRTIATLVDEVKAPGNYSVRWDASGAASGVYFYRLMVGEKCEVRKMVVMK
jgi:hypothetical protein